MEEIVHILWLDIVRSLAGQQHFRAIGVYDRTENIPPEFMIHQISVDPFLVIITQAAVFTNITDPFFDRCE